MLSTFPLVVKDTLRSNISDLLCIFKSRKCCLTLVSTILHSNMNYFTIQIPVTSVLDLHFTHTESF